MKKTICLAVFAFSCLLTPELKAQTDQTDQNASPEFPKVDMSPMDMAHAVDINQEPLARIIYSRPQKRDRQVFGRLVPYGEVWRTGANEATELTLFQDMKIGGKTIKAGTYSFYTIPEEKEWTIILNKSTNTWGAYDYHVEHDLVRIKVPVRKLENPLESLSMVFEPTQNGTTLKIGWDDRYVKVPFKNPES